MESLNVFAARLWPTENRFASGHRACQGCAEALAVRMIHGVLGRNTIVASATGCMEIISSSYPDTAWTVPWLHVAFENAAAVASGVEAGLKILVKKGKLPKRKITVVGMGGDGATADIGLQALSGAMERGHKMIYVCYDNEAYMNTGIQRSSSTPFGASTTTSPAGSLSVGQSTWKKNMPMVIAAHNVPYVATVNPSFPFDLASKVRKAQAANGPAYLHVYACCPTGWRMAPELAIAIGRLASRTGVFPLYEVENGKLHITVPTPKLSPLKEYIQPQGRFRHLDDATVAEIEKRVEEEYRKLERREGLVL
ncbi:MAG TPA: pyruvate synthase subunit PorB [Myxococcota bacterium]|nr:pyruvate synthase subunit PorB [Myxococcota bacterium]HRY95016.1 pyruvate synthase subunit PorB [Myxococcota bacterium]HSA21622.1 pyruvate synthase subunit PorB [Myxococcota bacterium]